MLGSHLILKHIHTRPGVYIRSVILRVTGQRNSLYLKKVGIVVFVPKVRKGK